MTDDQLLAHYRQWLQDNPDGNAEIVIDRMRRATRDERNSLHLEVNTRRRMFKRSRWW